MLDLINSRAKSPRIKVLRDKTWGEGEEEGKRVSQLLTPKAFLVGFTARIGSVYSALKLVCALASSKIDQLVHPKGRRRRILSVVSLPRSNLGIISFFSSLVFRSYFHSFCVLCVFLLYFTLRPLNLCLVDSLRDRGNGLGSHTVHKAFHAVLENIRHVNIVRR